MKNTFNLISIQSYLLNKFSLYTYIFYNIGIFSIQVFLNSINIMQSALHCLLIFSLCVYLLCQYLFIFTLNWFDTVIHKLITSCLYHNQYYCVEHVPIMLISWFNDWYIVIYVLCNCIWISECLVKDFLLILR